MIKKYIVSPNSVFNTSIILPLFEPGRYGFAIDGLSDNDYKDLFPSNKIRISKNEIDIKTIPSNLVAAYLDDDMCLKAMIICSISKKYYLFKVDHQKEYQLNIHQKYISSDLNYLMDDYEKHCKTKGKSNYDGLGDFSKVCGLNYFENRYQKEVKSHIDKESNVYRLLFEENNAFTTDFIYLVENKLVTITNTNKCDKKVFTLETMSKNRNDRQDCLLINSETKDIEYFIYTYKPYYIKHYFLLKNLGNDTFEFIKESVCFNSLFVDTSLKEVKFKNCSRLAARSFAKMRYENFYLNYIEFEEEEEFDEVVKQELSLEELLVIKKETLIKEVLEIVKQKHLALDIAITLHGKERILERIGMMNEEEMLSLAKVAYEDGLHSMHFFDKDPKMFKFLQHEQNKIIGKTLRLYQDILFFFVLEPPHSLVTCFPYKSNYEQYVSKMK